MSSGLSLQKHVGFRWFFSNRRSRHPASCTAMSYLGQWLSHMSERARNQCLKLSVPTFFSIWIIPPSFHTNPLLCSYLSVAHFILKSASAPADPISLVSSTRLLNHPHFPHSSILTSVSCLYKSFTLVY